MMKTKVLAVVFCVCFISGVSFADSFGSGANQFMIDFVPISGATNPTSGYGIVNNNYRMGKLEITNAQWTKFKAAYGTVTGTPSNAYDESPYFTGSSVPTNEVSWYEAAQFVNYLNTITNNHVAYKFTGTQGTGDYALATWAAGDAAGGTNLYRHKDAYYFLPTEDEWVKAAYWNGTSLQTYSNASSGDLVSGSPDPTKWNYYPSAGSEPWNVGSGVEELNGTHDMMGNVWEWMESPYSDTSYGTGSNRGLRGGSYGSSDYNLASSARNNYTAPNGEYNVVGFRVASVPEPCSLVLLSLGGLFLRRKRKA